MPELPEVEWMRGLVSDTLKAGPLDAVAIDARFAVPGPLRLLSVVRRGKHLLFGLPEGTLDLEPRLTGVLRPAGPARFVRWALRRNGDDVLVFTDRRRLARVRTVHGLSPAEVADQLGLGPEPWPEALSEAEWDPPPRRTLKAALLDPRVVAGVGNIGVSEACFRAALDPMRRVSSLTTAERRRLLLGVRAWIQDTLTDVQGSGLQLLSEHRRGRGSDPFLAYGRAGKPCVRCSSTIEVRREGGRGTWWCPPCVTRGTAEDDPYLKG